MLVLVPVIGTLTLIVPKDILLQEVAIVVGILDKLYGHPENCSAANTLGARHTVNIVIEKYNKILFKLNFWYI